MKQFRILAIAVATGRIGYVFLHAGKLKDWGLSRRASRGTKEAATQARAWITLLEPDVVVTERVAKTSTKSIKTRALIEVITRVAEDMKMQFVEVPRFQSFKNKYAEATALAERFPELTLWLPKLRRLWDPEPRSTVLFEALALSLVIVDG
jgi:hypothetical protein